MMDFDVKDVIARIEILIAQREMAKEDFYEQSGISSASFSQWNNGVHVPSKKKLNSAANVLGVDLEYILYGDTEKEKPDTVSSVELSEIELIFSQLTPSRQTKLLELARLYLDDQRRTKETQ